MTTIAYKNGVLASDGRMTNGTRLLSDTYNKICPTEGREYLIQGKKVLAYAMAGMAESRLVLERALEEGLDVLSGIESDDDFSAIVVTEDTAYLVDKDAEEHSFKIIEIFDGQPYSIGSGSVVANHFLQKGGEPLDAVVEAIKTDIGSGGDVFR